MIRSAFSFIFPFFVIAIVLRVFLGLALGVVFSLAWIAFKVLCVAGIAYCALTLVAPRTAQRLRERLFVDEA